jgi:hypothetical protein
MRRASILVAVVAGVVAMGATAAPPAGAAIPGINLDLPGLDAPATGPAPDSGARWARVFLEWATVQPAPGVVDERLLGVYARGARALAARGTRLLLVVTRSPGWASTTGLAGGPPAGAAPYARFIGTVAARLRGTVGAYEIWNEPDIPKFWGGPPDPRSYTRLLRTAYDAVKSADPDADVLFGGLTGNDYRFLERSYRHGARGSFDAVGVHTDIPCEIRPPEVFVRDRHRKVSRWSFLGYRSVHRVMLAHRDERPIWMTELGWSERDVPCPTGGWIGQKPAGVSEAAQADDLRRAYACLARDSYVRVGMWWTMRDFDPDTSHGLEYGLWRLDGSPRPAWSAFRAVVLNPPSPDGCVPHYAGPHVSLTARRAPRSRSLAVAVRVRADLELAELRLRIDGQTVRRIRGRRATAPLALAKLPRGSHVVTAIAVDVARNGGRKSLRLHVGRCGPACPTRVCEVSPRGRCRVL